MVKNVVWYKTLHRQHNFYEFTTINPGAVPGCPMHNNAAEFADKLYFELLKK
jgi:hypothetical protein